MPNTLVAEFRADHPNDPRNDADLTLLLGDAMAGAMDDSHPDFATEYRELATQRSEYGSGTIAQEFGAGIQRGLHNVAGKVYETAGQLGELASPVLPDLVSQWIRKTSAEGSKAQAEAAQETPATIPTIERVNSPSRFARWAAGVIGEQVPQMGGTMALGALGAAVGGPAGAALGVEEGLTGSALAAARLGSQAAGSLVGGGAFSYTQNQNYQDLLDQGVAPDVAARTSLAVGLTSGALDTILPMKLLNRVKGSLFPGLAEKALASAGAKEAPALEGHWIKRYFRTAAKDVPADALLEGGTEATQEMLSMAGEYWAHRDDPNFEIPRAEVYSRLLNNGVPGLLLGGLSGGGEAAFHVPGRPGAAPADDTTTTPGSTPGGPPPPAGSAASGVAAGPISFPPATPPFISPDLLATYAAGFEKLPESQKNQLAGIAKRESEGDLSLEEQSFISSILGSQPEGVKQAYRLMVDTFTNAPPATEAAPPATEAAPPATEPKKPVTESAVNDEIAKVSARLASPNLSEAGVSVYRNRLDSLQKQKAAFASETVSVPAAATATPAPVVAKAATPLAPGAPAKVRLASVKPAPAKVRATAAIQEEMAEIATKLKGKPSAAVRKALNERIDFLNAQDTAPVPAKPAAAPAAGGVTAAEEAMIEKRLAENLGKKPPAKPAKVSAQSPQAVSDEIAQIGRRLSNPEYLNTLTKEDIAKLRARIAVLEKQAVAKPAAAAKPAAPAPALTATQKPAKRSNPSLEAAEKRFRKIANETLYVNPYDPKLLLAAVDLISEYVKEGVMRFADAVIRIKEKFGEELTRKAAGYISTAWRLAKKNHYPEMDDAGDVLAHLTAAPAAPANVRAAAVKKPPALDHAKIQAEMKSIAAKLASNPSQSVRKGLHARIDFLNAQLTPPTAAAPTVAAKVREAAVEIPELDMDDIRAEMKVMAKALAKEKTNPTVRKKMVDRIAVLNSRIAASEKEAAAAPTPEAARETASRLVWREVQKPHAEIARLRERISSGEITKPVKAEMSRQLRFWLKLVKELPDVPFPQSKVRQAAIAVPEGLDTKVGEHLGKDWRVQAEEPVKPGKKGKKPYLHVPPSYLKDQPLAKARAPVKLEDLAASAIDEATSPHGTDLTPDKLAELYRQAVIAGIITQKQREQRESVASPQKAESVTLERIEADLARLNAQKDSWAKPQKKRWAAKGTIEPKAFTPPSHAQAALDKTAFGQSLGPITRIQIVVALDANPTQALEALQAAVNEKRTPTKAKPAPRASAEARAAALRMVAGPPTAQGMTKQNAKALSELRRLLDARIAVNPKLGESLNAVYAGLVDRWKRSELAYRLMTEFDREPGEIGHNISTTKEQTHDFIATVKALDPQLGKAVEKYLAKDGGAMNSLQLDSIHKTLATYDLKVEFDPATGPVLRAVPGPKKVISHAWQVENANITARASAARRLNEERRFTDIWNKLLKARQREVKDIIDTLSNEDRDAVLTRLNASKDLIKNKLAIRDAILIVRDEEATAAAEATPPEETSLADGTSGLDKGEIEDVLAAMIMAKGINGLGSYSPKGMLIHLGLSEGSALGMLKDLGLLDWVDRIRAWQFSQEVQVKWNNLVLAKAKEDAKDPEKAKQVDVAALAKSLGKSWGTEVGKIRAVLTPAEKFLFRLDEAGGYSNAFGSWFEPVSHVKPEDRKAGAFMLKMTRGASSSDPKEKRNANFTRRALFVRDKTDGKIYLLGTFNHNGVRIVSRTGKGSTPIEAMLHSTTYEPLASVRFTEAENNLRETFTQAEYDAIENLALRRATSQQATAQSVEESMGKEGMNAAAEIQRDMMKESTEMVIDWLPRLPDGQFNEKFTEKDVLEALATALAQGDNQDIRKFMMLTEGMPQVKMIPEYQKQDDSGKARFLLQWWARRVFEIINTQRNIVGPSFGKGATLQDAFEKYLFRFGDTAAKRGGVDAAPNFRHTRVRTGGARISQAEVRSRISTALHSLQAAGASASIYDPAEWEKLLQTIAPGTDPSSVQGFQLRRMVALVLSDVTNPTHDNLVTLLHEGAHFLFDQESEAVQSALHRAVKAWGEKVSEIGNRPASEFNAASTEDHARSLELEKRAISWLLGEAEKPSAPTVLYRGVPAGAATVAQKGARYVHGTPWMHVAHRGGKFGSDPNTVLQFPAKPGQLYYRGGSLAGDPFESTRVNSIRGYTWDQALARTKALYERDLKGKLNDNADWLVNLTTKERADQELRLRRYAARDAVSDLIKGTFEADIENKPGIWSGGIPVPRDLTRRQPGMRTNDEVAAWQAKHGPVASEDSLVEAFAQEFADKDLATSYVAKLLRLIKDLYRRAAMWVQEKIWGQVSPEMAESYFKNRVEQIAAGDQAKSFIWWLGGPKMRPDEKFANVFTATDGGRQEGIYDLESGQMQYADVIPDGILAHTFNLENAIIKFRREDSLIDESAIGGTNSTPTANADIAKYNEVDDVSRRLFGLWSLAGLNTENISPDQFRERFLLSDEDPALMISNLAGQVTEAGFAPANVSARIPDVDEGLKKSTARKVLFKLNKIIAAVSFQAAKARDDIASVARGIQHREAAERHLANNYARANLMTERIMQDVRGLMNTFKANLDHGILAGYSYGVVAQNIQEIHNALGTVRADGPDVIPGNIRLKDIRAYQRALNAMSERILAAPTTFVASLQALARLRIDWKNTRMAQVRQLVELAAETDARLVPLTEDSQDGRAMLAIALGYAKQHDGVIAYMELALANDQKSEDAIKVMVQRILATTGDDLTEARILMREVVGQARLAERIFRHYQAVKTENQNKIAKEQEAQDYLNFYNASRVPLELAAGRYEEMLGTSKDVNLTHKSEIYVAPEANSIDADVEASTRVYSLSKAEHETIPRADMLNIIERNNAWLNHPGRQRSEMWHTLKRQTEQMELGMGEKKQIANRKSTIGHIFGSLATRMDATGTPAGKRASLRLRQYVTLTERFQNEAHSWANTASMAHGEALLATGIKSQTFFKDMFYDRAWKYLEDRKDLRGGPDPDTALLTALKNYYLNDPTTSRFVSQPGAWAALEKMYRAKAAVAGHLNTLRQAMGIPIKDPSLDMFRDSIGSPMVSMTRRVAKHMLDLITLLQLDPEWRDAMKYARMPSAQAGAILTSQFSTDPAAFEATMLRMFNPTVLNRFVKPMMDRPTMSMFSAPTLPSGTVPLAKVDLTQRAWRESGGNLVTFARRLYELSGRSEVQSVEGFIGETFDTLFGYYGSLVDLHADKTMANEYGVQTVPQQLMNARISEAYPAEWMDYEQLDPSSVRTMVNQLAMHAAFGRDFKAFEKEVKLMKDDLERKVEELKAWRGRLAQANPGKTDGDIEKLLKREIERELGSEEWRILRDADSHLNNVRKTQDQFVSWFKSQGGAMVEAKNMLEVLNMLTTMVIQGPSTAMMQTIQMFDPITVMGVSRPALKMVAGNWVSLMGQAFGSFFQMFHKTINFEADMNIRQLDLGYFDPDTTVHLRDKLRGILESEVNTLTKGARIIQELTRTGVSPVVGVDQPTSARLRFASVKPWAPFTQFVQWMRVAMVNGGWRVYDDLLRRTIAYAQANPGVLDDPNFRFKAEHVGWKSGLVFNDDRAFDYMAEALRRWGMDLEMLTSAALNRQQNSEGRDMSLFTAEQYGRLASMVNTEINLDSNVANRPIQFFNNPVLRAGIKLTSWSVGRIDQLRQAFREPGGQASYKAMLNGMKMMAVMMPLGVAYAWLLDKYGERALGKKPNIRGFGQDSNGLAFVEQTARVGTFGLWGDVANTLFNLGYGGDLRGLSLDSRVLFMNSTLGMLTAMTNLVRSQEATYSTVYRSAIQAMGGAGYLQFADIMNHAFSLDNAEARVVARINAGNYLRAVGREMGMDVRTTSRGMASGAVLPNPVKPWISEMALAAYANNKTDFDAAYERAIQAAREEGKPDPADYVRRSYQSSHPLRSVFATSPSIAEYHQLLQRLSGRGAEAVSEAVNNYNRLGETKGIPPYDGRMDHAEKAASGPPTFKLPGLSEIRMRALAPARAYSFAR